METEKNVGEFADKENDLTVIAKYEVVYDDKAVQK